MAGNSERRPATRLSVRSATEPLPIPLPPPPRRSRSPLGLDAESRPTDLHAVPPQPHFVTRFPTIDTAHLQTSPTPTSLEWVTGPAVESLEPTREQPVGERSLASPGVILALAASVAVMCAFGWYEKHGVDGFKWEAIKSVVEKWTMPSPAADEDLPYITSIPLTPVSTKTESIANDAAPTSKKNDQVLLSDLPKDDDTEASRDDRTQRR